MKKRRRILVPIMIIIIIILIPLSLKFTGYLIKEEIKQVQLYFYDELINCSLDGYVFIGDKLIGKSINGIFNLTYENYQENIKNNLDKEISLFGKLRECFNEDSDLYFDKYWESFKIEDYYFEGESTFNFKTQINSNNPIKKELQAFIQPNKIQTELDNINLNKNQDILESPSKINDYLNNKISYVKDWDFNKEKNYWQTPEETLNLQQGDCEDYSTLLLSLFLAYNNSLNCYNIVFTSHVTTLCHINEYYIYYDQQKTELKKQINKANPEEVKNQLTNLKQVYFENYGIDKNNETETKAHYAFNDNNYIEFNNEDDFINWQYNLEDKKSEQDIFENLEQELLIIRGKYSQENQEGELATEKPPTASTLATEKPTLKGFFEENYILLSALIIILIILIIILIKINKK